MKRRRELQSKDDTNLPNMRQLNEEEAIRNDIGTCNSEMIAKTTEENKSLKVLTHTMSKGKEICNIRNNKEMLKIIEEFYKKLYAAEKEETIC